VGIVLSYLGRLSSCRGRKRRKEEEKREKGKKKGRKRNEWGEKRRENGKFFKMNGTIYITAYNETVFPLRFSFILRDISEASRHQSSVL